MTFRTGLILLVAAIFPYSYDAVHFLPRTTTVSLQSFASSSSSSSTLSVINTIEELPQNSTAEEQTDHGKALSAKMGTEMESIAQDRKNTFTGYEAKGVLFKPEEKDIVAINNHSKENLNHAFTTFKSPFNNFSSFSTDGPETITSDSEMPSTHISEITTLNEDQSTTENLIDATITTLAPSKNDSTTIVASESSTEYFTSFELPTSSEANDRSSVEEIASPDAVALDGENDDEGMTNASSESATVNFSTTSTKILNIPSKTKNAEVTTKIFSTNDFVGKTSQAMESKDSTMESKSSITTKTSVESPSISTDVELSSINSTEKSINKSTTTLASGPNCNLETTTAQTPINILGLDEHPTAWVVVGALVLVAVLATGLIHIFKKPKPSIESRRLIRFSSLHESDSED